MKVATIQTSFFGLAYRSEEQNTLSLLQDFSPYPTSLPSKPVFIGFWPGQISVDS